MEELVKKCPTCMRPSPCSNQSTALSTSDTTDTDAITDNATYTAMCITVFTVVIKCTMPLFFCRQCMYSLH